MNTCLIGAGWALVAFGLPGVSAAAGPIIAYQPREHETSPTTQLLGKNATREEVLVKLGPPDMRIGEGVWVYWNFQSNRPEASRLYDTLVLAFRGQRVSGVKLTSAAALRGLLAQQPSARAPGAVLREPLYTANTPRR